MVQLTGQLTGTQASDVFSGNLDRLNLEASTVGAGASNAIIEARGGDDRIRGQSIQQIAPEATADIDITSYGIELSNIDAGGGNDTITGIGSTLSNSNLRGSATGYGFLRGAVNGKSGNDAFIFSGNGRDAQENEGFGVSSAILDGGGGDDRFEIKASASEPGSAFTFEGTVDPTSNAVGIERSTISGGRGQENILIEANASGLGNGSAIGATGSKIDGDSDNDRIKITAKTRFFGNEAFGTVNTSVFGGNGNDIIEILGESNAGQPNATRTISSGVDNNSQIDGGNGNDTITISSNAIFFVKSGGGDSVAYGARGSTVRGGSGDDAIALNATSKQTISNATAYAAFDSEIVGGAGSDTITLKATEGAATGNRVDGAFRSKIRGGSGDDIIQIMTEIDSPGISYGAFESEIRGGVGDDRIEISIGDFGTLNIKDSLINGGAGNDVFDVGIGSGTIRGGAGDDLAIVDFFDEQTMDFAIINGGVRISGMIDEFGQKIAWSQDILGVEQLQFGGQSLSTQAFAARVAS